MTSTTNAGVAIPVAIQPDKKSSGSIVEHCIVYALNHTVENIAQFQIMAFSWFGLVWFGQGFINCLASDL